MLKVDPLEPLMMVGLHQLGCNVSWIAKLFGSGRERVYRQLRTLIDLAPAEKTGRPPKKTVSEGEDRMIAALSAAGISPIDIAQALAIDLPTVLRTLFEKERQKRACLRMKRSVLRGVTWILFFSGAALAAEVPEKIKKALPDVPIERAEPIPIEGPLYEVTTSQGTFYVDGGGRYLLNGDLFDLILRKNLTEERREARNKISFDFGWTR